ncbi:unknown pentose isomerase ECA1953 [Vibrio astriarenae]|uniref:TIM barrel protein n=1 Tax=Vibrio astriarenae TaxID=1481923 RepID=A0A7Z2T3W7_9VIBR|nr:sugar phosphate isomerase/epimerase family protein [Vibrio astriarenae]QIA63906.1 TIM barrel protein [Vibrio astriarenae]GAL09479.1 unknown pentose isomerase ECA1953 [Vibrio sp. C7]
MFKHAVITPFLGQQRDRFSEYNEPKTLEQKLQTLRTIDGMTGAELVYPYEVNYDNLAELKLLLVKYDVKVACINVNVKVEKEFISGGLTSPDKAVRERAVSFIKEAKDYAEEVGADKVQCCPLSDGYEFSFQADYVETWQRLCETFGEAGDYKPHIPLFIEYKPNEVRGRCYLDNAAKTICLIKDIGNPNIGVTLDYGHSLYGDNNPAEELALLNSLDMKYYIHINDNDGKWDWDYFCGSRSLMQYIEFIYYLKKFNYQGWLTSDTSPTRWDIVKMFEANIRMTNRISSRIDTIGMETFGESLRKKEYMDIWADLESYFIKI